LYVINLETKTVESVTTGLSYAQSDADFSPDGTLLAVSGSAPRFSVYEVPTWQKRNISATYNSDTCRFSPDGSILAVGYSSGKGLCFYNPSTGAISEPINVGKSVRQISWSSDGALLALACYNGGVRVYDYASGTLLDTPNTASMNAVGLSPAVSVPSRKVKTVHHDGGDAAVTIRVHDPETGAVIGEVASSGSAEVMLLEPASVWLAAKDDRVGGRDKIIASEVSIPAGAEPPIVMSLDYLGATVTISSNLTTQAGAPGDEVVIRNWTTRELVAKVVPDANGDWIAEVPPGTYDVSYIAENCAPVIHGPYTIELP
jgi:WD40 repeat protein